jgi:4-hydroxybenzoate polyprenyltransferase
VYNRLLEVAADAATNPSRTAYIAAHSRTLWSAFFISSGVAAVVVGLTASLFGALFLLVLFVCGLLYTNAFKGLTRLIPGFKTLYVALAFAALVFLPFGYAGRTISFAALAPFAGWVFWNGAIMQLFLDVKDLESDAQAGLRTIPLLIGKKRRCGRPAPTATRPRRPPSPWLHR